MSENDVDTTKTGAPAEAPTDPPAPEGGATEDEKQADDKTE